MMNRRLLQMRENEVNNKRVWLDLISFYNSKIDEMENAYSIYQYLKREAVDEVLKCDVQIQYLDGEIKDIEKE